MLGLGKDRKPAHKPGAVAADAPWSRQAVAAALRRRGLDDRGDCVQEWGDLLKGTAKETTLEGALDALLWIVDKARKAGVTVTYARHAADHAHAWAERKRQRTA